MPAESSSESAEDRIDVYRDGGRVLGTCQIPVDRQEYLHEQDHRAFRIHIVHFVSGGSAGPEQGTDKQGCEAEGSGSRLAEFAANQRDREAGVQEEKIFLSPRLYGINWQEIRRGAGCRHNRCE